MDWNPNETARRMAEGALSRLVADLTAGRNEVFIRALTAMSQFRRYSWQNALVIQAQRPSATEVAGIHTWHDVGRAVKEGEKGITVLAPIASEAELTCRQAPPTQHSLQRSSFRAAYVFDVSQTEGKPLPELARPALDSKERGEKVKLLLTERHINPNYVEAVAYVVARGLGLDAKGVSVDLAPYRNADKRALAQSLAVIQKTSAQILDELLPDKRFPLRPPSFPRPSAFPLDAEGFAEFHSEYQERVVQSIVVLVGDRHKAEDITARAFELAWERRATFRGDATLQTWIQAIARNEARNVHRREPSNYFKSMDQIGVPEVAAKERVSDELEKRDDRFRLHYALAQVPAKLRRALVAHFVEGLSIRDIARRQQIPLGTVLSRIHKGKQLLRKAWEAAPARLHVEGIAREAASRPDEGRASRPTGDRLSQTESREPAAWDR